jgi:hypothetical protein
MRVAVGTEDAREQNDRGAGRHVGVIGKQQTCEARGEGNEDCDENQPGHIVGPEARGDRGKQHDTDRHQRSERLKAAHKVEHDQHEEVEIGGRAKVAGRAQELRVEAFQH